jgi:cysteine-rich repeat protein
METRFRSFVMILFFALACGRHDHRTSVSSGHAGDGSAVGDTPVSAPSPDVAESKDALAFEARADRVTEAPVIACGNGRVEENEQCDDGNTLSGDGCSSTCQLECGDAGVEVCPDSCFGRCGALCCAGTGLSRTVCGNGRQTRDEACDDGNTLSGDGCSGDCKQIEPGYHCVPGWPCSPICGDGVIKAGETCDDGNTRQGDGCSRYCLTEPGWDCTSGVCVRLPDVDGGGSDGARLSCGDGIRSGAEECDFGKDNSDLAYGGCNTQCMSVGCGDGLVNGPEECALADQNGKIDGREGCTFVCTRPAYCGDGILNTSLGEECDLGDLNGVKLDGTGNPSDDARVQCTTNCTLNVGPLGRRLSAQAWLP